MRLEQISSHEEQNPSVMSRIRREYRNPSMITVIVTFIAILTVPLAVLVPGWADTARTSFQFQREAEAQRQAALLPMSASVSSRILPWMFSQIDALEVADSAVAWNRPSFTQGPCNVTNLSQLPSGVYADAISSSCSELHQVQDEYSLACSSIEPCVLPRSASVRLLVTRQHLVDTFTGAGFVSDYNAHDERWMR